MPGGNKKKRAAKKKTLIVGIDGVHDLSTDNININSSRSKTSKNLEESE
jgi:hypothetical protein